MSGFTRFRFAVVVFALIGWCAPASLPVFAASSNPITSLPPTFDAGGIQNLGKLFEKCANPGDALKGILEAVYDKKVCTNVQLTFSSSAMPDQICNGPDTTINPEGLKCDKFISGGSFLEKKLDEQLKVVGESMCTLQCRNKSAEWLKGQMDCLGAQADSLGQQIAGLQASYTQNMQQMQQDVQKLDATMADRQGQLEDVTKKLRGDERSGAMGLLKLKDTSEQMIAVLRKESVDLKKSIKDNEGMRKTIEESAKLRTQGLVSECFNTAKSGEYHCDPGGPPVSLREHVLCRFRQEQYRNERGDREQDAMTRQTAEARTRDLDSLLENIVQRMQASSAQQTLRPMSALSPSDVKRLYGSELGKFNGNGLNIQSFVTNAFNRCYNDAVSVVKKERAGAPVSYTATGPVQNLSGMEQLLKDNERKTAEAGVAILDAYAKQYAENMAGLTGMHLPVMGTEDCEKDNPNKLADCIDSLQENMQGLMNGTVKQSTIRFTIRGNDPKTTITDTCQGLSGCITKLQNLATNLEKETQKVKSFRNDYVLRANQNIERYTKQMAQQLSTTSQQLRDRQNMLNKMLSSITSAKSSSRRRGPSGIQFEDVDPEPLEFGEGEPPQLYKMPQNLLNLVGSQMSPPMMKVNSSTFADALSDIGSATGENAEKMARLDETMRTLEEFKKDCPKDKLKEIAGKAEDSLKNFNLASCLEWEGCSGDDNKLAQTVKTLSSALEFKIAIEDFKVLNTGVDCYPTQSKKGQDELNPDKCKSIARNIMLDFEKYTKRADALNKASGTE